MYHTKFSRIKYYDLEIGYVTTSGNYKKCDYVKYDSDDEILLSKKTEYIIKGNIKCIYPKNKQKSARNV